MPTPAYTDAECYQAMAALARHDGRKFMAAQELGVSYNRIARLLKAAKNRGFRFTVKAAEGFSPDEKEEEENPVEERRGVRDLNFWRLKANRLEKSLAEAEHIISELQGLKQLKPLPRQWAVKPSERRHGMVTGGLLSDIHAGEKIQDDQVANLNAFDLDICERRLRRYFTAAATLGPRWASDGDLRGFWLALNGDLLSGTIHDELAETNACTSHEAYQWLLDRLTAGIDVLAAEFPKVHVTVTPGNHSRTTARNRFKQYGLLSYDTLMGDALRRHYVGNDRLSFEIASGTDLLVNVFQWRFLQTHGNYIGTGGGKGFAGQLLPVLRGGRMLNVQQASAQRWYDCLLTAHFHTSGQLGAHFSNGSVVGYSEMANGIRAAYEPPQQWLYNIHEKWMLRDRAEVKLEDPMPPEKPRVRVAAWTEGEKP